MNTKELFDLLKEEMGRILKDEGWMEEDIRISSVSLTPEEAIGITRRKDFPILTGKEVLLQASWRGGIGQAFTQAPAAFSGTIKEVWNMDPVSDPHTSGLFIASLNAMMNALGQADNTVHCKAEGPEKCALKASSYIKKSFGNCKITLIGYQPALLEELSKFFSIRVLDLNPENIGSLRYKFKVEDGETAYEDALKWADLILCTGSTICNGTIIRYMNLPTPTLFYGTTISGAAPILGLDRLCFADEL